MKFALNEIPDLMKFALINYINFALGILANVKGVSLIWHHVDISETIHQKVFIFWLQIEDKLWDNLAKNWTK